MTPSILLVDNQHDVLRLLHSVLDSLQRPELEIVEAASGEEALQEAGRRHIDLLVTDYALPGMTGLELMDTLRAAQPDMRVILVTDATGRKARAEMLKAGASAIFNKPVPLADFLDAVERSLGLARTIFPAEQEASPDAGRARVSELLATFRQDRQAAAVLLLNDRGLVVARAGDLRDASMEVSLVSALTATGSAGLKVAASNRQEALNQFSVFSGGDHDLILMPVDAVFSLLLAGDGLSSREGLFDTIQSMLAVRNQLARSLRSLGVSHERSPTTPVHRREGVPGEPAAEFAAGAPAADMESLLTGSGSGVEQRDLDAFWEQAAVQHANLPISADVIPYEEARKLGLTPDEK
jgi:CheY-like chemotaxis protein